MNLTSEIWWKQITGARNFLQKTADTLASGKSVVIHLADVTPWLEDMHEILTEFLNKKFGGRKVVREIDSSFVDEPAMFVFENFCSEDVKYELIPIDENAYVKFLAGRDDIILNDVCLLIRGASNAQAANWYDFIADYHQFGGKGLFLLETDKTCELGGRAGVENFSFETEVSEYDCYAFNIFLAAQFGTGDKFTKRYLAELASNATGFDVERGAECIKCGNDFLNAPENFLTNKSREEVKRAVWVTQLKLIFPLLEIFRRDFVKKYELLLEGFMPCHLGGGKIIHTPDEAEFGELLTILNDEKWRLNPDDWETLKNYREARNKLAHLDTLTTAQVQTILHC